MVKQAPRAGMDHALGRRHGRQFIITFSEAQTMAVQRLLAIDTPPFLSHQ